MLFFLLVLLARANIVTIEGSGGAAAATAYDDFIYAYSQIKQDVNLSFYPKGSGVGVNELLSDVVHFAGLDEYLNDTLLSSYPEFVAFPFLFEALVPQINIPNLTSRDCITLNRSTLARIWSGNITNWSDEEILDSNKAIAHKIPNANISVIYRSDESGTTHQFTIALSAWSKEWEEQYGRFSVFPDTLRALPNYKPVTNMLEAFSRVVATPYSITYVSLNFLIHQAGFFTQWAALVGPEGNRISPSLKTMNIALSTAHFDDNLMATFDANTNGWPIATFSYIVFNRTRLSDSSTECNTYRELARFIRWILTFIVPTNRAIEDGYAPLTPELADVVLGRLSSLECGNESLLKQTALPRESASAIDFLVAFALLFLVLVLMMSGLHIYYIRTPRINLVYSFIFLLGSLLLLITPIFWWLTPTTFGICQGRVWLTSLGFSIILGVMFSRLSQIREIYLLQQDLEKMMKTDTSLRAAVIKLSVFMGICFFVNLTILITWTVIDPYKPAFVYPDNSTMQVNLEGRWACQSIHLGWWMVAESLFILAILIWGVIVVYQTWSFSSGKGINLETKWVLIAFYNVILNLVFLGPLLGIGKLDDSNISMVMAVSIDFSGGGIILAVLLPRLIKMFKPFKKKSTPRRSKNPNNNSTIGNQSTTSSPPQGSRSSKKLSTVKSSPPTLYETDIAMVKDYRPSQGVSENWRNSHTQTSTVEMISQKDDMLIYPIHEEHKMAYRKSSSRRESSTNRKRSEEASPKGDELETFLVNATSEETLEVETIRKNSSGLGGKREPQELILTTTTSDDPTEGVSS